MHAFSLGVYEYMNRKPRASVQGKLDHCQNANTYQTDKLHAAPLLHFANDLVLFGPVCDFE